MHTPLLSLRAVGRDAPKLAHLRAERDVIDLVQDIGRADVRRCGNVRQGDGADARQVGVAEVRRQHVLRELEARRQPPFR